MIDISTKEKYRLVTRSDFDGLICATLLKELDMISSILFAHPSDLQKGKIELTNKDIVANLPYNENALLVFDHHASEALRISEQKENWVIDVHAPSAARIIWKSFGGKERFANIDEEMMAAVDKADSAQFTLDDVLDPQGWTLLSFVMDARTGLGRFKNFRISNQQLMLELVDYCRHKKIDDILENPDVKERIDLYRNHQSSFIAQLQKCTQVTKNFGVIDLRNEEIIFAGNRFMVYALFPDVKVSMHVMWGRSHQNVVCALGKSIFNRDTPINLAEILLQYDGGGHSNAGTCQFDTDVADYRIKELTNNILMRL